jgi:hypothetical protein
VSTDIRTSVVFLVECHDCAFKTEATSAGSAESEALDHIEFWFEKTVSHPYYNHTLKITNYTRMGRR